MATQKRRSDIDLIASLRAAPHRFQFFQAMRLLTLAGPPAGPRIRFRTPATLAFPASEILAMDRSGPLEEMTVGFFGLTGPAGVLPAHYTELLMERRDALRDTAAHAFLDLFSHRALSLFAAAWRKYRFHLGFEQGEGGGFADQLLALAGLPDLPVPARVTTHFAGALAQRPLPVSSLVGLLGAYFGVPVALEQFLGRWCRLPERQRSRLGSPACVLGDTACLGERLWERQTRVGLRLGPLPLPTFLDLLPDSPGGLMLRRFMQACLGHSLACDLTLVLAAGSARPAALRPEARPRLGVDLWLGGPPPGKELDDARFRLLA